MSYYLSVSGHQAGTQQEAEDKTKRLLDAIVTALDEHGGDVSTLSFSGPGNLNASGLVQARALVGKQEEDGSAEGQADKGG